MEILEAGKISQKLITSETYHLELGVLKHRETYNPSDYIVDGTGNL